MRHGWMIATALTVGLGVVGCKVVDDYQAGKNTPLAADEQSPSEQAHGLLDPLVPYLPDPVKPVAGPLVAVVAAVLTWRRGRRINAGKPVSTQGPILGAWGARVQPLVEALSHVFGGVEVGPEGSGIRRAAKVVVASAAVSLLVPQIGSFVAAHPAELGGFIGALAVALGLEKEVSKVLPTQPPHA